MYFLFEKSLLPIPVTIKSAAHLSQGPLSGHASARLDISGMSDPLRSALGGWHHSQRVQQRVTITQATANLPMALENGRGGLRLVAGVHMPSEDISPSLEIPYSSFSKRIYRRVGADVTVVGLLVGVSASMGSEMVRTREEATTGLTAEGFLSSVATQVSETGISSTIPRPRLYRLFCKVFPDLGTVTCFGR